jgi:hypothetical protein
MPRRKQPPNTGSFRHNVLGGDTTGTIAFRCGGRCEAANHCVWPTYEPPVMPTLPSHQSCAATHSTVS